MKLNKIVSGVASLALSLTAFAGVGKAVPDNSMKAQAASSWRFDLGGNGAGLTGNLRQHR